METRLVRSGKGAGTIHKAECPQLRSKATPWRWAENKDRTDIEAAIAMPGIGLHPCSTCKPLEGWNGPFHACEFRTGCACEKRCEAFDRHLAHRCCT